MTPPRRRRTFLRLALTAAMLLGLGVVTTVAVAWGLAAWLPQRNWRQVVVVDPLMGVKARDATVFESRTDGAVRRSWHIHKLGWTGDVILPFRPITASQGGRQVDRSGAPLRGPQWGRAEAVRRDPCGHLDGCEHATGWPLVAGWYEIEVTYSNPGRRFLVIEDLMLARTIQLGAACTELSDVRALPLNAIWPGLAADTAFYAGAWFVILFAPRRLRRELRRRHGACVQCGYDLAGLAVDVACPECGCGRAVGSV